MKLHLLAATALLLAACSSAGDPATEVTTDDAGTNPTTPPLTGDPVGNPSPGDGTKADASAEPPADGGAGAPDGGGGGGGPVNAFTNAPPYVTTLGPSARSNRHAPENPAGQPCMSCHDGSRNNIRELLFGGTIYKDAAGTQPAPRAEVRVRDATGAGFSAFSDDDGNFFFLRGNRPGLASPARAGQRNATTTRLMTNVISEGDCNACHKPGGQPRLQLP